MRRLPFACLALVLLAGRGAAAEEGAEVRWSSREDFAGTAPGSPGRVVLENIDLDAVPGALTLARGEAAGVPAGEPILFTEAGWPPPAVALACGDAELGCLLVWIESRPPGNALRGALIDQDGGRRGAAFDLAPPGSAPSSPSAALDPDARQFVVLWADRRAPRRGAPSRLIVGRRVGARGARALGDEYVVARDPAVPLLAPRLSWAPAAGAFLAVWMRGEGGRAEVVARRVGRGGATGEEVALTGGPGPNGEVRVASAGGSSGWLAVWRRGAGGEGDIVGRLLSPSGAPAAGELVLRGEPHNERGPFLAPGPEGRLLLLWEDYREKSPRSPVASYRDIFQGRVAASEVDLFVQLLDATGAPVGPERRLTGSLRNQLAPAAAWSEGPREYLAVWQDGRTGYESWDIAARPVEADGVPAVPETTVVLLPEEQLSPEVACFRGSDRCLVAWWGPPRREHGGVHLLALGRGPATGVARGLRADAGSDAPGRPRLELEARVPAGGAVSFRARSASTEEALERTRWSGPFSAPGWAAEILAGRWVELEVTLAAGPGGQSPVVDELRLAWPAGAARQPAPPTPE